MKKNILKKTLFSLFFFLLLIINLLLPQIMNQDNILIQKKYDRDIEKNREPSISVEQMEDNKSKIDNFDSFLKNSRLLLFFASIIFFIVFLILNFEKLDISKVFLIISIPMGLLYIFLMPIGAAPDEEVHWYKAYEVSKGYFISDKNENNLGGRVLPIAIKSVVTDDYLLPSKPPREVGIVMSYEQWMEHYEKTLEEEKDKEDFIVFSNTAIYTALAYIPQAIGIFTGRLFKASYLTQAYLGRIFNYLVYIGIMFYSMKKIPFKKMAIFIVSLLPIMFQEAASLSIDGIQMASITLLISYTLYLTYDNNKEFLNVKDYIILAISALFTAITKFVYLPICLIIFIIPKEKFKNVKFKYVILSVLFLAITILDILLMKHSMAYKNICASKTGSFDQLKFVLQNPIRFCYIFLQTIQENGLKHTFDLFGQGLCWDDVSISPIYIIPLLIIGMYFIYFERPIKEDEVIEKEENKTAKNKKLITKIFMMIIAIGTSFGIVFTEYIICTSLAHYYILGIQARYFVPLLLLYGVAFSNSYNKNEKNSIIDYLSMFLVFANLNALVGIMFRFL